MNDRTILLVDIADTAPAYVGFDPNTVAAPGYLRENNTFLGMLLAGGVSARGELSSFAYRVGQRQRIAEFSFLPAFDVDDASLLRAQVGVVDAAGNRKTAALTGWLDGSGRTSPSDPPNLANDPTLGVVLDADAQTVTFLHREWTQTLTDIGAGPWWLTVSSSHMAVRLNTGQAPWVWDYDPGYPGWSIPTSVGGPYRFASEPFLSAPTDNPPNTRWEERLLSGANSLSFGRFLSFLQWGENGPLPQRNAVAQPLRPSGSFTLSNVDGAFDLLVTGNARDLPVAIRMVSPGDALASATSLPRMAIDSASGLNDGEVQVNLVSPYAKLDDAVKMATINAVNAGVQSSTLFPFTDGVARSVPLITTDVPSNTNAISDDTGVGAFVVREKGRPWYQSTTPPDWTRGRDGKIVLARTPVGTMTADVGSWNCALAANGGSASASSTLPNSGSNVYSASTLIDGDLTGRKAGADSFWNDNTSGVYPDWIQVNFAAAQTLDSVVVVSLQDGYTTPILPTDSMTGSVYVVTDFDVQVPDGAAWRTVASVTGNRLIKCKVALTNITTASIRIVVKSTPRPYSHVVEVEAWTVVRGTTFADFANRLLARNALPGEFDTPALDEPAGYVGPIGFHTTKETKLADVLKQAASSFNGCVFTNRLGELVATRMDATNHGGKITRDDLKVPLVVWPDLAPNLSTRAAGQRNYKTVTEFATDATVTADMRKMLSDDYRVIKSYSGPLAPMYSAARNAPPIGTLLDDPADVQAFIDYLGGKYQLPMLFGLALLERKNRLNPEIDLGWSLTLEYASYVELATGTRIAIPRYGLQAPGKEAVVVGMNPDLFAGHIAYFLWFQGDA